MGALDGFRSIWTNANAAFGQGIPSGGAQFDRSAELRGLQNTAASASPDGRWTGTASDSYGDANGRHARTLGGIADLDRRLGLEVDRAAAVVTAGRRDLEAVRQRVNAAAASVPNTTAGERMMYAAICKGSSDIQTILNRSHADMSEIGERIRGIGDEYQTLSDGEGSHSLDVTGDRRLPATTLDLNDIVYTKPFDPTHPKDPEAYGPPGYKELVPNSGVWVPDPSSPSYTPTPVEAPLDLDDIVQYPPYDKDGKPVLGPSGYMELVPHSGTWVPEPGGIMWPNDPPTAPVDLTKIVVGTPGVLGKSWQTELIPHSGVWVPDPHYGGPS